MIVQCTVIWKYEWRDKIMKKYTIDDERHREYSEGAQKMLLVRPMRKGKRWQRVF